MATIRDIQNQIDNNTFDPNKYSRAERDLIDAAIEAGVDAVKFQSFVAQTILY